MSQPKKLTVPQLQAQIVKRQGTLLRRIAAKHTKIAELFEQARGQVLTESLARQLIEAREQLDELHGQLHTLPSTMVDVWMLGPRAAYAVRVAS